MPDDPTPDDPTPGDPTPDDVNRWLRAVRPPTSADDGWAESAQADQALDAIHRATGTAAPHPARRAFRRPSVWLPSLGFAAAAIALVLVAVSSSTPPAKNVAPGTGPHGALPALRPAALDLTPYTSCDDLLSGLRAHTAANIGPYGISYPYPYGALDAVRAASSLAAGPTYATAAGAVNAIPQQTETSLDPSGSGSSHTNVAEAGVDEPDIVKTDGSRVVSVTNGELRVIDANTRAVTGSLDLSLYSNWQSAQLLVSGAHAVVILGGYGGYGGPYYSLPFAYNPPGTKSSVLFIDLTHTPTVTNTLQFDGAYVDARMVGSEVRLVVATSPTITVPVVRGPTAGKQLHAAQVAARTAPLSAWLPTYTNGHGGVHSVPCTQVSHPAAYSGTSMMTIYSLDLTTPDADPMPISVAADADTVYGTTTSLYVASHDPCTATARTGKGALACKTAEQATELHRFDIEGAMPVYLGSGTVPGYLLNQYSLSDYDGYLRVATTIAAASTTNSVYVLDAQTLKVTGKVGGLGKGEQIYAVRFLGPLGYVVTFKQTDPLYVLNLNDPAHPAVVGTLELTGFSSYLHDVGDGRLIGVGQEAGADGRVAGLQVSLFDVSTTSTPQRFDHVVLSNSVGESAFDPHAFLYWVPTGLLVVPLQTWDAVNAGKVLVIRVHGTALTRVGLVANDDATPTVGGPYNAGILRSMIVNGQLWTLSSGGMRVSNPATLSRETWIPFA